MLNDNNAASAEVAASNRTVWLFSAVHFIAWMLISFLRNRPYNDSLEALAWGLTREWGTNKHPPLTGWILELGYRLTGGSPEIAVYALAQLCVVVAFIYVYKLARKFVPPAEAALCAIFLEGTLYYTTNSMNFNPNTVSLALVPAVTYHFYQAVKLDKPLHWILTGLFAGMAMLAKYTNGIVLLALFLYLVFTPEGRRCFRRYGAYLALFVAFLVVLPHVDWLVQYDFRTLSYAKSKGLKFSGPAARIGRGFLNLFVVFFGQFLKAAVTIALFAFLYFRTPEKARRFAGRLDPFLICAGILPLAIVAVISMAFGTHTYPKYAYAFIGYFPLVLFSLLPVAPPAAARRRAVVLTYAAMAVFIGYAVFAKSTRKTEENEFNGRAVAEAIAEELTKQGAPTIRYVGGTSHLVSVAASYLDSRPRPFFQMNPAIVVWEDEAKILANPVLVLAESEQEYDAYKRRYPDIPAPTRITVGPNRPIFKDPYDFYLGVMVGNREGMLVKSEGIRETYKIFRRSWRTRSSMPRRSLSVAVGT